MQILVEIIKMQHVLWLNIHALCDITAQSTNTRAPRVTLFTLNLCINAIQGMEISKASINSIKRTRSSKFNIMWRKKKQNKPFSSSEHRHLN